MLIVVRLVADKVEISSTVQIMLELGTGVIIFGTLTLLYESITNRKSLINLIKRKEIKK